MKFSKPNWDIVRLFVIEMKVEMKVVGDGVGNGAESHREIC